MSDDKNESFEKNFSNREFNSHLYPASRVKNIFNSLVYLLSRVKSFHAARRQSRKRKRDRERRGGG